MRHLRTALAVLAAITALGACTTALPGTPKAGPSTRNVEEELAGTQASDLRKVFTSTPQQVNDYWSAERMRSAQPRQPQPGQMTDVPKDEPVGVIIHPTSGPVGPTKPLPRDDSGDVWTRAGLTATTMGRLYMSYAGGYNGLCSASVVNSDSGVIVATAAHCVWDYSGKRNGSWADNVLFIPGDTAGQAPYGRWTAEALYAPVEFQQKAKLNASGGAVGEGWSYDIAYLRMRPLGGKNIEDALGGQGQAFDAASESIRSLGYPSAPPFDGTQMRSCASPTWTANRDNTFTIPCKMTPGSSGGPWYTRFDDVKGVGYLVSTNSTGGSTKMNGSLLGKIAYDIYKKADAGS
ncbi:serine protease [Allokutzneria sp. NRRL B-24872]|uniref:trypsin-like serine peptidase n=1 Tax=Allokutzneria sp. NRRL B-24872 TaxID=1137961 RepID=UPI000A3863E8|nr:trypsin-like peptidase domain-containing protein [Allokutzneria sp. NRRL B-24872]